jgi:hypothetical protein
LKSGSAFGAKGALVDGTIRIAFDVDDLAVASGDELATADGTVGTDARHLLGASNLELLDLQPGGLQIARQAEEAADGEPAPHRGLEEMAAGEARAGGSHLDLLPGRRNCDELLYHQHMRRGI